MFLNANLENRNFSSSSVSDLDEDEDVITEKEYREMNTTSEITLKLALANRLSHSLTNEEEIANEEILINIDSDAPEFLIYMKRQEVYYQYTFGVECLACPSIEDFINVLQKNKGKHQHLGKTTGTEFQQEIFQYFS